MNPLSKSEALELLLSRAIPVSGKEEIETEKALGRILAEDLVSMIDVPAFDNSAMDGYAIAVHGHQRMIVSQRIAAGEEPVPLEAGTAARIFTGAKIPRGADAVVMQEDCALEEGRVKIGKMPGMGANIRKRGEDVSKGSVFLGKGSKIRPQELALIASVGLPLVPVYRKLKVALFFTGNELVMPDKPLESGKIYNSNRYALIGLLESLNCQIVDLGIVPDDFDATLSMLDKARSQADLVMSCGGVSVGEEDHVKAAVEKMGSLSLWKVSVKPGKPFAFGDLSGIPFIGLPGNPVSAFLVFCFFARPFILRSQNAAKCLPKGFLLKADFVWKGGSRLEWLRAGISQDSKVFVHPEQGSAILSSLSWAQGIVEIPPFETVAQGDEVRFFPFQELFS